MNYSLRTFKHSDFEVISSWWKEAKEIGPTISMLPEESTLILEVEGEPKFCLTLLLTNCKEYAYLENFVSDISFKHENRKKLSEIIINASFEFAKNLGYKNVIWLAHKDGLKKRYIEMGFTPVISDVQTFGRKVS